MGNEGAMPPEWLGPLPLEGKRPASLGLPLWKLYEPGILPLELNGIVSCIVKSILVPLIPVGNIDIVSESESELDFNRVENTRFGNIVGGVVPSVKTPPPTRFSFKSILLSRTRKVSSPPIEFIPVTPLPVPTRLEVKSPLFTCGMGGDMRISKLFILLLESGRCIGADDPNGSISAPNNAADDAEVLASPKRKVPLPEEVFIMLREL
jgi:hypothetical protein